MVAMIVEPCELVVLAHLGEGIARGRWGVVWVVGVGQLPYVADSQMATQPLPSWGSPVVSTVTK